MQYIRRFWPLYLITVLLFILLALAASQTVTTIAENAPVAHSVTIVIDAGHGGVDGGATSCTGALESRINLEIALRLEDLCHLLGYRTQMIRRSDVSVYTEGNTIAAKKASDLRQRVKIVNDTEGGILISIHQNIFADSRYDGAQVFYANTPGSRELAVLLQQNFASACNPGSHRQEKEAKNVFLMRYIERTGVLVECGFLSNPEEEERLRSKQYQNQLCAVIVSSLSQYLRP